MFLLLQHLLMACCWQVHLRILTATSKWPFSLLGCKDRGGDIRAQRTWSTIYETEERGMRGANLNYWAFSSPSSFPVHFCKNGFSYSFPSSPTRHWVLVGGERALPLPHSWHHRHLQLWASPTVQLKCKDLGEMWRDVIGLSRVWALCKMIDP